LFSPWGAGALVTRVS